jgi:hypothetical protein
MIDNLTGGMGIDIQQGSSTYITATGVVRWNGNSQRLEVMDRDMWIPMYGGVATIAPGPTLNRVISWASVKMEEEEQLKVLMDKHPGLKDTKEKFDIMLALVRNAEFTEHK